MRALASPEARTVLGAAVADDVAGLLILTVVVRTTAEGGGLAIGGLVGIMVVALGFLTLATVLGAWLVPRIFAALAERARTDGALVAIAIAFTLAIAGAASGARLAPIVGAFVAGIVLGRSPVRDDLHRRLAPVGHLLIPLFFLQIGTDARIGAFGDPWVLGVAAVLCVVAVGGKIVAGVGVTRGGGDRMLIGVGMIPRGEVGLIFAGLGLSHGVLDARSHAALLLVVMATTIVAPPWIRRRIDRARRRAVSHASVVEPPEGWLRVTGDEVELNAEPPPSLAARVGLDAALLCDERGPGSRLLTWLSSTAGEAPEWDEAVRQRFFVLLRNGGVRAWRFLDVSGLLARLLPDLDTALRQRMRDPFDLDPQGALRWEGLDRLRDLVCDGNDRAARIWARTPHQDLALLAALARSAFADRRAAAATRRLAGTIGLGEDDAAMLEFLVAERHLLPAAAARLTMGTEDTVLELAAHLRTAARADALYLLAAAETEDRTERERLDELFELVSDALTHPELTGAAAEDVIELRRAEAERALTRFPEDEVRRFLAEAPRRYLLAQRPEAIARHMRMLQTRPVAYEIRLHAEPASPADAAEWMVDVVTLDRRGLLAAITGAFAVHRLDVQEAFVSTWSTGVAIDVFRVRAPAGVDWEAVRTSTADALVHPDANGGAAVVEGAVDLDNRASPWHTIVEVRAHDRQGLLHRVATALARAGAEIHYATATTRGGEAVDTFFVTDRNGHKLDAAGERDLRAAFAGSPLRRKRLTPRRRKSALASHK
jgi:glycine cleavage system regulatory protein